MALTYEEALKQASDQGAGVGITSDQIDPNYVKALQDGSAAAYSQGAIQSGQQAAKPSSGSGSGGSPGGGNSAEGLIDSMYSNRLTAQERQLKMALEDSLNQLEKQKNTSYANQTLANKYSNEAMLAQGLNSGAIGQAALSSNTALQGSLGAIDTAKTNANSDYQNNLLALQDSLQAEKMNALLSDYYNSRDFNYQTSRDKVSDNQFAQQFGLQQQQLESNLSQNQQNQAIQLLGMGLTSGQAASLLGVPQDQIDNYVNTINKGMQIDLQNSSRIASGSGGGSGRGEYKPKLTISQTQDLLDNGVSSPELLSAYKYYTGADYGGGSGGFGGGEDLLGQLNLTNANYSDQTVQKLGELISYLDSLSQEDALSTIGQNRLDITKQFSTVGLSAIGRRYGWYD